VVEASPLPAIKWKGFTLNSFISNSRFRAAALAATVVVVVIATAGPALAQPPVPIRYSTRALGMGGTMLLSAGPIEAGYFNPGAITQSGGLHIFATMQLTNDGSYLDFAKFLKDNRNKLSPAGFAGLTISEATELANDIDQFTDKWQTLNLDPMIGLQLGSLSFSAYSVSRLNLKPDISGLPFSPPVINAQIYSDIVINGAFGKQFGPFLHGGVGVRYLQRQHSNLLTIDPQDMGDLADFTGNNILLDKDNFDEDPWTAFQVDACAMFTLTKAFAAGGVIRGLYSSSSSDMPDAEWKPEISAGIRLKPLELLMGIPLIIIKDITLEANIRDISNAYEEDYSEKLQFGAEIKLPLFALRAGFNRGQASFGAGFHFLIVDISGAISTVSDVTPEGVIEKRYYSIAAGIGF